MNMIAYSLAVSTSPPEMTSVNRLEHPSLVALLAYWTQLSGKDAMPRRVEPRKEISHLLKHMHVCDVMREENSFRFHLIGDAVFQGIQNQTGKLVQDHPDMGVRLRFPILMSEVLATKKPVRGVAIRDTEGGKFHAESIWLPFGVRGINQIVGMTVLTVTDGGSNKSSLADCKLT